ncbi:hypothetical protein GCM10010275_11060 [Streptomyces litmocidini]|nr:hypothetical protein GCM10010275_11060 [Streptomyces litmocidini]
MRPGAPGAPGVRRKPAAGEPHRLAAVHRLRPAAPGGGAGVPGQEHDGGSAEHHGPHDEPDPPPGFLLRVPHEDEIVSAGSGSCLFRTGGACHAPPAMGEDGEHPYEGKYTVSIDPSSIPNFGGQPQPQAAGPAGPVVPDQDLVKQLLEQMELKYVVDDEGDLAAPWEEFRTYFMFRGEAEQQVFSVRTFYDRPHSADDRAKILDAIDDWNRRTLWPKVYTHLHEEEDGSATLRLIGEAQMLIGTGVALEHFVSSTVSWVRASIEFDKWIVEQFGLESPEAKAEGAEGGDEEA